MSPGRSRVSMIHGEGIKKIQLEPYWAKRWKDVGASLSSLSASSTYSGGWDVGELESGFGTSGKFLMTFPAKTLLRLAPVTVRKPPQSSKKKMVEQMGSVNKIKGYLLEIPQPPPTNNNNGNNSDNNNKKKRKHTI